MTDIDNPLSPEQGAELKQSLIDLDKAEKLAKRFKQAGGNADEQLTRIQEQRTKTRNLIQTFFPNGI